MRALVTGATGFLGGALALRLKTLGHEVLGLGRDQERGRRLEEAGIPMRYGALADTSFLNRVSRGQDRIFHCAALSSPWGPYRHFHEANVLGTRNVAAAAVRAGVPRLVHVSSPSIYVGAASTLDVEEDAVLPTRSVNHYATTKRLSEHEASAARPHGIEVVTIRPQAIFGPGDPAIVPRLVRANRETGLPLFGDGNHLLDVTYVGNVVDALLLCAAAGPAVDGRTYNITNGEPIAFRSFLTGLLAELGETPRFRRLPYPLAWSAATGAELFHRAFRPAVEPPLTRYGLSVLAHGRTLSIARARRELGYAPRVSVAAGAREYAVWWRGQS